MKDDVKAHDVQVHNVTYLSVGAGTVGGAASVVLTIRPDENFRPHNVALTAEQANRLRQDLNRLFKSPSPTIEGWLAEQEETKGAILDAEGNVWVIE